MSRIQYDDSCVFSSCERYNDYQLNHTLVHGTMKHFFLQLLNLTFQQLHWLLYLLKSEVPVDMVVQFFVFLIIMIFMLILLGK